MTKTQETHVKTSADYPCTLLALPALTCCVPVPSTLSAFRRSTRLTHLPRRYDDQTARQTRSQSQGRGDSSVSADRNVVASTSQTQAQTAGGKSKGKGKGKNAQEDSAPLRSKRGRDDAEDTPATTTSDETSDEDDEEDVGEHNRPGPDARSRSASGVSLLSGRRVHGVPYPRSSYSLSFIVRLDYRMPHLHQGGHLAEDDDARQFHYAHRSEGQSQKRRVPARRSDLHLADPAYLEENAVGDTRTKRTELSTKDMWVAQIADCCVIKASEPALEAEGNLGVLRVRWLYSQAHVEELNNKREVLHSQTMSKVKRANFNPREVRELLMRRRSDGNVPLEDANFSCAVAMAVLDYSAASVLRVSWSLLVE